MTHSFGFLSTYPPTQCGIATFSQALMGSIARVEIGDRVGVVRAMDAPDGADGPEVVGHLPTGPPRGHRAAADALNLGAG